MVQIINKGNHKSQEFNLLVIFELNFYKVEIMKQVFLKVNEKLNMWQDFFGIK